MASPRQGAVDVNILLLRDEGVDDQAVKFVDIVDTFRLQEQPPFDKRQFIACIKKYIKNLIPSLEKDKQNEFKKNIEGPTKYLVSKLKDLQLACMTTGALVFAYYKEGSTDPTFLYFGYGLKEVKC